MKKIGIIDSGVGGLTILKDLMAEKLDADFYYISDEDHVPYGGKTQAFMFERISSMTEKLIEKEIDGILIACNTATSETINLLRNKFTIPFVGIEPYINYIHKSGIKDKHRVALILTEATSKSERFLKLVEEKDKENIIDIYPLKTLALLIESLKKTQFSEIEERVKKELSVLKNHNYSHVILGCTHYPILKNYIEENYNILTINPAYAVVTQLTKILSLQKNNNSHQRFFYNPDNRKSWVSKQIDDFYFLNSLK